MIEAKNIRPVDLARAAQTAPQNVHRFINAERKLTREWAEKLAPHIPGATPADLIFAPGGNETARRVRLGDWLSAGKFAEMMVALEDEDGDVPTVVETLPEGDWIAFEVVGDSMNLLAPEGSRIFVDRREKELRNGFLYAVAVEDGATFKRFRAPPARLEPVSSNTEHQAYFFQDASEARVIGRVRKLINNFD